MIHINGTFIHFNLNNHIKILDIDIIFCPKPKFN